MIPGVYASLCTPFTAEGALDLGGLTALVRFGLEGRAGGFLCNAIAGEVGQLTAAERRSVARTVVEEVAGRVPVIVGLSPVDDRKTALAMARHARDAGADCLLVPARSRPTGPSSSTDLVSGLAHDLDIEIMVQEAPRYSGAGYGLEGLKLLAATLADPLIVKIEGGDWELGRVRAALGETASTWGGDGGMYLLECLRGGAAGVIPGVEVIDRLVLAYRAEESGASVEAEAVLASVLPYLVFAMQSQARYVASAKWVLHDRGLIGSVASRVPGVALSAGQMTALARAFGQFDTRGLRRRRLRGRLALLARAAVCEGMSS